MTAKRINLGNIRGPQGPPGVSGKLANVAVSDPIIYIPTFVYTQLVEVLENKIYHLGI